MVRPKVIKIESEAELDRLIDRAKAERWDRLSLLGPYAQVEFLYDKSCSGSVWDMLPHVGSFP